MVCPRKGRGSLPKVFQMRREECGFKMRTGNSRSSAGSDAPRPATRGRDAQEASPACLCAWKLGTARQDQSGRLVGDLPHVERGISR